MALQEWISGRVFRFVHGNNLVYNTCWEDPRLDRQALNLKPTDSVMVITSAGCNAIDYALCNPREVHAVDMNPRQNALLQLKLAAVRSLDYEDYFQMFGHGYLPNVEGIYANKLRGQLSKWSKAYWDRWIKFFDNERRSFYFRGTSGAFARGINVYLTKIAKIRPEITEIVNSKSFEEQQALYNNVRERIWTRTMRFALNRDTTLSMLGVPKAQRRQIDTQYPGGIVKFIEDSMDAVFAKLPIQDNYFWRVYITGHYTPECCPEYLKPENYEALRNGVADKIHIHTDSVQGFLEKHNGTISRFVLLDHMDWLSDNYFALLESEWQAIIERAAPETRILWRSGGLKTEFLDRVSVRVDGQMRKLPELLKMHPEISDDLHQKDRVHTYGSFYVADLVV
ncbi:MAG: BtaA family protein [Planctomycetota bacterium]|nr:BtaA family protein [Planctomycetota bacterium]